MFALESLPFQLSFLPNGKKSWAGALLLKSAFLVRDFMIIWQLKLKELTIHFYYSPTFPQSIIFDAGKITIEPMQGNKIDHNGIKVELLGQIEMYFDRGNDMTLLPSYEN
ncbi:hypothetical protein P8452_68638 [Trifolium repens]|nr:hypothetical protein P8452_68638 [Trifolium repens]